MTIVTVRDMWLGVGVESHPSRQLATAGGLLFNDGMDRYLRAHDIDTGNVLWQTRLPPQTVGGTISFSIQGRQYIAISAGGGALASLQVGMTPEADMTPGSNATYVFALP